RRGVTGAPSVARGACSERGDLLRIAGFASAVQWLALRTERRDAADGTGEIAPADKLRRFLRRLQGPPQELVAQWQARPIYLRWLPQAMRLAASRTFWTAGSSRPIRTAMMARTTSNSISVNAVRSRCGYLMVETLSRAGNSSHSPDPVAPAQRTPALA